MSMSLWTVTRERAAEWSCVRSGVCWISYSIGKDLVVCFLCKIGERRKEQGERR